MFRPMCCMLARQDYGGTCLVSLRRSHHSPLQRRETGLRTLYFGTRKSQTRLRSGRGRLRLHSFTSEISTNTSNRWPSTRAPPTWAFLLGSPSRSPPLPFPRRLLARWRLRAPNSAEGCLGVVAVGSLRSRHALQHSQVSQTPTSASSPEAWRSFHSLWLRSYLGRAPCKHRFCHKFGRLHVAASLGTFGGTVGLHRCDKC